MADRLGLTVASVEVLLATGLTLLFLEDKSLWLDEVTSIVIARNWASMWQDMVQHEANMWLYYVLLHFWLKLGESEFLVRSLSASFAVVTVPVAYALGTRLFGPRVGIVTALLLPVNAFFIHYAQEARSYSLLVLMTTLSSYFFARGIERPSWKYWGACMVSSVLAIYAHFFGALVLIAHATSLVFLRRRDIPWRNLAVNYVATALLLLPLVLFQPFGSGQTGWIRQPEAKDIGRLFLALAGSRRNLLLVYAALCFAAWGSAVVRSLRFKQSLETWRYAFLTTWLLVPVAIAFSFSLLAKPLFVARYLIICLSPLVLLAAVGLSNITQRWLFTTTLAMLIILSGSGLSSWYTGYEKEDWRGATRFVLSEAQPGDAVFFYASSVRKPFEYYLDRFNAPSPFLSPMELASSPYAPGGGGQVSASHQRQLGHLPTEDTRVWLVLSHDSVLHGGRDVKSRLIQESLARKYTTVRERKFKGIRVLLYERAFFQVETASSRCQESH
ncbi:MAG: glycosyltransferase family 39 protein [Dehalococcoidia bacterium]